MFSKNKWATAGFQRLLISFQNGTATFFESDSQLFRVDNNLYAGRQAHQIICIRQRIRFVEIIDTPGQPTLRVAPGSKTADMEISYCQYFGSITQAGAYVRPELSPPVKCPAEKEEWAVSHLLVLQSQVGFDDGRTTAHPVFVALGRLMNIHYSAAFCCPLCVRRIISVLRTLRRSRAGSNVRGGGLCLFRLFTLTGNPVLPTRLSDASASFPFGSTAILGVGSPSHSISLVELWA